MRQSTPGCARNQAYHRKRGGSFHSLVGFPLTDCVDESFNCLNSARDARSKSKERFTIRVVIR